MSDANPSGGVRQGKSREHATFLMQRIKIKGNGNTTGHIAPLSSHPMWAGRTAEDGLFIMFKQAEREGSPVTFQFRTCPIDEAFDADWMPLAGLPASNASVVLWRFAPTQETKS